MAEENNNRLIINDTLKLCADISALYLSEKLSDVILLVENEKLFGHKTILAARSGYFENLFLNAQSVNKQVFTGITPGAFRKILKYIYTGTITLESSDVSRDLELVGLATQYNLEDLKAPLISKCKKLIDKKNVFAILDTANLYNLEDLTDACHLFFDLHAEELKLNDGFNNLSQTSMVNLLQRDKFLLPEVDIFNIVAKWRKSNTDLDDLVLNCVRLPSISIFDIVSKVWPLKLMSCSKIVNAISEIVGAKPKTSKHRGVFEANLATESLKSEVISGTQPEYLLSGNRNVNKYCYHKITSDKSGITVKFGSIYAINTITFQLFDKDERYYMYYIEVSTDQKIWTKILDYSMYPCRSVQNLYFEPVSTQYIRIIGTHNTNGQYFHIVYLEAYYRYNVPKIINNVVVPITNVALLEKKAMIIEGNGGDDIINGSIKNKDSSVWTKIGTGSIIVQLAQPYLISSMRLRLYDKDSRFFKFYIETSSNKKNWEMAVDRRNQESKSWQDFAFSERITVFVRLTGTYCSATDYFSIYNFECPSSPSS